ncbi:hypothetical protein [Corynebacterium cystitidis]|uniref:Uncharacterized protein n=1 Tax=Corynebacterium cystitidis DSM 20524 TaxID=1121357 RepID=A0A1H9UZF6_9CORY|nr:hypothetical protein [Corynebacterium cystitidis]WJY83624.1 hypothetical protein CCYS_13715 [Corynebacterium cystitidis DSM 20524]SES14719.1 hypothetical protein SAMN05661109_02012 [Corynebacterium cystitidis DSM 20524]SNV91677.1 Uncharacterised protein [Corynebacterium cystitidis]
MTSRSIDNAYPACAATVARLDNSIMVARTDASTMLLNMPRSIDELSQATQDQGFFSKLKSLFTQFMR